MMKKIGEQMKKGCFLFVLLLCVALAPANSYAGETEAENPIYGSSLNDGEYDVEMESSSSMFRIVKARLLVSGSDMSVVMTLSGVGYLKLFAGTAEEALEAPEESFIPYVEDEEGAYTYTIPVEALDAEFDCAAYSKRKQRWYDRTLVVSSSSLPEDAFRMQDGDYTMEVTLAGGSGRAGIVSPAHVEVSGGAAVASIEWSSPDYDYMIVDGVKYHPVNTEGNSVFEIPVLSLDGEMEVTADTVAMSKPHEIAYTLTFHADTLQKEKGKTMAVLAALAALLVIAAIVPGGYGLRRKKRERNG